MSSDNGPVFMDQEDLGRGADDAFEALLQCFISRLAARSQSKCEKIKANVDQNWLHRLRKQIQQMDAADT